MPPDSLLWTTFSARYYLLAREPSQICQAKKSLKGGVSYIVPKEGQETH